MPSISRSDLLDYRLSQRILFAYLFDITDCLSVSIFCVLFLYFIFCILFLYFPVVFSFFLFFLTAILRMRPLFCVWDPYVAFETFVLCKRPLFCVWDPYVAHETPVLRMKPLFYTRDPYSNPRGQILEERIKDAASYLPPFFGCVAFLLFSVGFSWRPFLEVGEVSL